MSVYAYIVIVKIKHQFACYLLLWYTRGCQATGTPPVKESNLRATMSLLFALNQQCCYEIVLTRNDARMEHVSWPPSLLPDLTTSHGGM